MLEYLIYVLKCLGCVSAMVVIIFLTLQVIYFIPRANAKKLEFEKDLMDKLADEILEETQEESEETDNKDN